MHSKMPYCHPLVTWCSGSSFQNVLIMPILVQKNTFQLEATPLEPSMWQYTFINDKLHYIHQLDNDCIYYTIECIVCLSTSACTMVYRARVQWCSRVFIYVTLLTYGRKRRGISKISNSCLVHLRSSVLLVIFS